MPARDQNHNTVRHALERDGWTITHDPYYIGYERDVLVLDLAAERTLAAERGNERIAVEIKRFGNPSILHDFHAALGQYLNYQMALEISDPNRKLYLAISSGIHARFKERDLPQAAMKRHNIHVLVYNEDQEVIEQWI
jgi:hypothetical protein